MGWKLFLDDDLDNPNADEWRHTPEGFLGAKTSTEAIALVQEHGLPDFMDLDFDLGMVNGKIDTAEVFLKWLEVNYHDTPPAHHTHSRNNQGALWIDSWMDSWRRSLDL